MASRPTSSAEDEGRHRVGREELWGESWYFDFAAGNGTSGGYVRLGLYPNLGVSWFWLYLTGAERPLVVVRDHRAPLPQGDQLELRTDAFAAELHCVDPLHRWSIRCQGTGIRLARPADAFRGEPGGPVPVQVDLEWHGQSPVFAYEQTTRYEQTAWVRGELLIGAERVTVDCPGQRDHSWGVRDWWLDSWMWTAGRLGDGTAFHGVRAPASGATSFQTGYIADPDGKLEPIDGCDVETHLDAEKLPTGADLRVGPLTLHVSPVAHAPVLLVANDGRRSRFARSMCRFDNADGRSGYGWTEYNWPDRQQ